MSLIDDLVGALTTITGRSNPTPTPQPKVAGNINDMKMTYGVSPNYTNETQSSTSAPTSPSSDPNYTFAFNNIPRDVNYKSNRSNFQPQQPPKPIGDLIRKYFPNEATTAATVAATENGTYDPKRPDNVNPQGGIDRGIFQINSNTFNGLIQRQPHLLRSMGITSFNDMYDPEKNIATAKIIREGSRQANPQTAGWGPWYGWQNTGYNINNGYFSHPHRISYELSKTK